MGVKKRVARATVYPLLALRGLVVFPQTTCHFDIARDKSVKALEAAAGGDQCLFLVSQKDVAVNDPTANDPTGDDGKPDDGKISTGGIAAIAGSGAALVGLVLALIFTRKKKEIE
jgi:hypothetical protein